MSSVLQLISLSALRVKTHAVLSAPMSEKIWQPPSLRTNFAKVWKFLIDTNCFCFQKFLLSTAMTILWLQRMVIITHLMCRYSNMQLHLGVLSIWCMQTYQIIGPRIRQKLLCTLATFIQKVSLFLLLRSVTMWYVLIDGKSSQLNLLARTIFFCYFQTLLLLTPKTILWIPRRVMRPLFFFEFCCADSFRRMLYMLHILYMLHAGMQDLLSTTSESTLQISEICTDGELFLCKM